MTINNKEDVKYTQETKNLNRFVLQNMKAQVTIFIIIAIVLIAGIAGYFLIKDKINMGKLGARFQPVENYFIDCIKQKTEQGKDLLGSGGGYIEMPEFEPGNNYAPFSNILGFNGASVPYWYYVSRTSVVKEKVPSKSMMETQLKNYIEGNFKCDFSNFEASGYYVNYSKLQVSVKINDMSVEVNVNSVLNMEFGAENARQTVHNAQIDTKLGRFYKNALEIYNSEKKSTFLESYAIDAMRLYAPVDGVEISCSSKIWNARKVVSDLNDALEANINAIKVKGNYYKDAGKYFIVPDLQTEDAVNFIYSRNWPSRFEVWPADAGLMEASPVGSQEGLGILGFCYVPYHFVYDMYFPVMIQIYDNKELFQFPVSVVVSKNKARTALEGEAVSRELDLCKYKNTEMSVYTYNSRLEPVEAQLVYKCFDTECDIGNTEILGGNAVYSGKFPQCVNGFIVARAPGYSEKKTQISTNNPGTADIILDKIYNVSVRIDAAGAESGVLYFRGEDYSASLIWPEQKVVQLSEGSYNITLQLYSNTSLVFPATSKSKCISVPKPGLLGMFGGKEQQCFNIDMPQQVITQVLRGGGKTSDYFTEDRLVNGKFVVKADLLPLPRSLDELQKNYEIFDTKRIVIEDEK